LPDEWSCESGGNESHEEEASRATVKHVVFSMVLDWCLAIIDAAAVALNFPNLRPSRSLADAVSTVLFSGSAAD
jgi:hypothetical protein